MPIASLLLLAAAVAEPVALPGWMTGCWIEEKGDAWTEECWTAPRGGMMIGSGRSGQASRLKSWETMQIILPGPGAKMAYWAAPQGANRTMFAWQSGAEPGITFVNAANDYPQRIRYWREGAFLIAETALRDGGKAQRWRYRRQG